MATLASLTSTKVSMAESMKLCSPICLGLPQWTDCCGENSKGPQEENTRRFKHIDEQEAEELSHGFTPTNTAKNTKWALFNFQEWTIWRKRSHPDNPVPDNIFEVDANELDKWLSRYVAETRNKKGAFYTPSTLYQLLCGLYRHIKITREDCPNFIDKKSTKFRKLHGTLDSLFRKLHESGIGRQVKHAEVISSEEEEKLWASGQLGTKTPRALAKCSFLLQRKELLHPRR